MSEFNWACPFCNRHQTVSEKKCHVRDYGIYVGDNADGDIGGRILAIGCSNIECKKVEVRFIYGNIQYGKNHDIISIEEIKHIRVTPESSAKILPDYIPAPIAQDYYEACRIVNLSPKASATLARRCLQGMIRNFCSISKSRLVDEISEIKKRFDTGNGVKGVSEESVDAIDAVRKIGNIGAHMEKDINVIIDVEPEEASILINLLESLFDEWYIARHKREERFAQVTRIAMQKEEQKRASLSTSQD
ncbi:DUF4145 domain-containing protein [Agrobacterium sp. B1(2019)]|uniref:DUF4145 domain-containing protein n=1 Tax=Agrobacterium sp. B1(2019) TaxID=2607032 RepID=UPI0011F050C0|nr:DUF4145 domain-containing protein [Agrobacterium sp. B1(2019)]TZG36863.1 DUF4145 domain-containing protein [Agrobacterium sp. B1(2019)]